MYACSRMCPLIMYVEASIWTESEGDRALLITPLVLSATGDMAKEATVFYKRLASCLTAKWDQLYSVTMSWLRYRLTLSLLRSAIQCIRGACSSIGQICLWDNQVHLWTSQVGLVISEANLILNITINNYLSCSTVVFVFTTLLLLQYW